MILQYLTPKRKTRSKIDVLCVCALIKGSWSSKGDWPAGRKLVIMVTLTWNEHAFDHKSNIKACWELWLFNSHKKQVFYVAVVPLRTLAMKTLRVQVGTGETGGRRGARERTGICLHPPPEAWVRVTTGSDPECLEPNPSWKPPLYNIPCHQTGLCQVVFCATWQCSLGGCWAWINCSLAWLHYSSSL